MVALDTIIKTKPYPGLRPFYPSEADLFFGREEQVDQLLEKLYRSHFVAVVGPSGCGKSSLVKAGLIPALKTGFLAEAGARWRVLEMRPSNKPFTNLAKAMVAAFDEDTPAELLRAELKRSPKALMEVLRNENLRYKENVLLIVDQFEELFRFRQNNNIDEVTAFINLLIASTQPSEISLHIVITMRSDYLGECSLFHGLPEILNENQFLTPRLTREQSRKAITGPALVCNGCIEPELVNTLLNDLGVDHDQLPLMQHALMRMWDHSTKKQQAYAPEDQLCLQIQDYVAVGRFSHAISDHANQAYESLGAGQKKIAEQIFKRLTDRNQEQNAVRTPCTVQEIAAVAQVSWEKVAEVADVFRSAEYNFITPDASLPLTADTYLDISHESIMRQWDKLKAWMEEEQEAGRKYRWLYDNVKDKRELLRGIDLRDAQAWKQKQRPNEAWATRYKNDPQGRVQYDDVMLYLHRSRKYHKIRKTSGTAGIAAMLLLGLGAFNFFTWQKDKILHAHLENEMKTALDKAHMDSMQLLQETILRKKATEYSEKLQNSNLELQLEKEEKDLANKQVERMNSELKMQKLYNEFDNRFLRSSFYNCTFISESIKRQAEALLHQLLDESDTTSFTRRLNEFNTMAAIADTANINPNNALRLAKDFMKQPHNQIIDSIALGVLSSNLFYDKAVTAQYAPGLNTSSFVLDVKQRRFAYNIEASIVLGTVSGNTLSADNKGNYPDGMQITSLAFRGDHEMVGIARNRLVLWNNHQTKTILLPVDRNTYAKLSPDGKKLFTYSAKADSARLWDVNGIIKDSSAYMSFELKNMTVNAFAFAHDSKSLAIGHNGAVTVWNWPDHPSPIDQPRLIKSIGDTTSGKFTLGYNSFARQVSQDAENREPGVSNSLITAVTFSKDNKTVLFGSYNQDLWTWNIETGRLQFVTNLKKQLGELTHLSFSPDGRKVLAGSQNGKKLILLHLDNRSIKTISYGYFVHSEFLNDSTIVTADYDGDILVWKIYPEFKNAKEAFDNISLQEYQAERMEDFYKKATTANYKDLLASNDPEKLLFAASYYYDNGAGNRLYLEHSQQLLRKLLNFDSSRQNREFLLRINNELYTIQAENTPVADQFDYYSGIVALMKENIVLLTGLDSLSETKGQYTTELSNNYGNLSYYLLFVRDFNGVIAAAHKGMEIFPQNDWIYTNLALGYLCTHQYPLAESIYTSLRDKLYSGGSKPFKKAFLEDFDALTAGGIISRGDQELYDKVAEIKNFLQGNTQKIGSH